MTAKYMNQETNVLFPSSTGVNEETKAVTKYDNRL